jgi:hypothetical protein
MSSNDPIRIYVKELVSEYMKDYAKQDVEKLVEHLVPEIDKIIAERMKLHIAMIMTHLKETLNIQI